MSIQDTYNKLINELVKDYNFTDEERYSIINGLSVVKVTSVDGEIKIEVVDCR